MSSSRRSRRPVALALTAAALLVAGPGAAEIYTVTLKSGNSFDSRYPPRTAGFDPSKVMLMTEWGNWVALDRDEISGVATQTQTKGYGTVIDTTTISLGFMANDKATEEELAAEADRPGFRSTGPDQNYTIQQFAEPSATQGIPGGLIGGGSSSTFEFIGGGNTAPPPPPPSSGSSGI